MECPLKDTKELELIKEIQRLNKLVDELINDGVLSLDNVITERGL